MRTESKEKDLRTKKIVIKLVRMQIRRYLEVFRFFPDVFFYTFLKDPTSFDSSVVVPGNGGLRERLNNQE